MLTKLGMTSLAQSWQISGCMRSGPVSARQIWPKYGKRLAVADVAANSGTDVANVWL